MVYSAFCTARQPAPALSLTKNCLCLSFSKLKHRARLCQQNKLGHFPIHAAAFAGATKAMEVILMAGTDKKKRKKNDLSSKN